MTEPDEYELLRHDRMPARPAPEPDNPDDDDDDLDPAALADAVIAARGY